MSKVPRNGRNTEYRGRIKGRFLNERCRRSLTPLDKNSEDSARFYTITGIQKAEFFLLTG